MQLLYQRRDIFIKIYEEILDNNAEEYDDWWTPVYDQYLNEGAYLWEEEKMIFGYQNSISYTSNKYSDWHSWNKCFT